jgi:hypothetical protein
LEDAQLRPPVPERQAQALNVGIPGEQFRFDGRDLAATAFYSCGHLNPFRFDLIEGPAIPIQRGPLDGQGLPALDYDIDVLRIQLDSVADALC